MKMVKGRLGYLFSLFLWLFLCVFVSSAHSAVVHVKPSGNDGNSGLSWALAKKTVQAAINAANQGDEIWVAEGTYPEHIKNKTVGPSGSEVAVDTALYGGFAGTETNRNERNYNVYFTILDGTNSGAVLTITAGAGLETRVDGFCITRGSAGISCSMSSPTITNNFVYSNSSSGIYIGNYRFTSSTDYVFPVISHNTIIYNTASYGSGIHIYGARGLVSMPSSAPQITNNTIGWNTASSTGGGIGSYGHSSPYIADNTIFANSAAAGDDFTGGGGGIFATALSEGNEHVDFAVSTPKIINNIITANAGGQLTNGVHTGGGIHVKETDIGVPLIANNSIVANHGAGVWFSTSFGNYAPIIQNNLVAFNTWGLEQLGDSYAPTIKSNCVYGNVLQGRNTNYQGIADQTGLNGNISADPKLENYNFGQVHLQPDSPCIDAGSNDIVEAGWKDIDGQDRIHGGTVDIGADESNGSAWNFSPPIIHVRPDGNDSANGLTWETAKKTITAGINSAMATSGEVWVAAGMYTEHILVPAFVYLYGGFLGNESTRDARNVINNVTIIDGGGVHGVVRIRNAGYLVSAVDGFTIQNGGVYTGGNYQQMYGPGGLGGGININVASPYIANNVIKRNSLAHDNTPGAQSLGGGIYAWVSYAEISGNTITENEVLNAGQGLGGGIYCSHSLPVIRDNRISQNRAKNGSAIYCDSSSPSIKNNTIENNSFYDIGMPPYSGAASGAINLWLGDSFLIEGNLIRGNLAGATGGQGAGILVRSNFAGRIQNNLIVNNSANGSGGGIYAIVPVAAMESLYIVNNTIVGNTGAYYAEAGGGLALFITAPITTPPEPIPNRVILANNIIAYNSSGIYLPPSGVVPPTMANNDIYPLNASSYINLPANPTDIHVDPQFVNRPGGDLHLTSSSLCIDAGDNSVNQLPAKDFEGNARIQDGNIDMGAYESPAGSGLKDELVLNFGPTYGLYQYDQAGGWKQWNSVNPSQMVTVDFNVDGKDELVAAFPGYGLYTYDSANGWQRINTVIPESMGAGRNGIACDYGAAYGLWLWDKTGGWKQINTVKPDKMIAADIDNDGQDELIAAFSGYGLYVWDDPDVWTQINTVVPDAMIRAGTGIACDYGATYGLWHYEQANGWQQLNTVDPGLMLAVDIDNDGVEEGIIAFAGYGLYTYEPATNTWTQINTVIPDAMIRQGNGIACDYGAAYGLWFWSLGGGWQQLNTVDPGQMTVVDIDKDGLEELVVSFSGYGLYYFHQTTGWHLLNDVLPVDFKPINFYP